MSPTTRLQLEQLPASADVRNGAGLDLRGANSRRQDLSGLQLRGTDLSGANLSQNIQLAAEYQVPNDSCRHLIERSLAGAESLAGLAD